jgi:hypothetical protein
MGDQGYSSSFLLLLFFLFQILIIHYANDYYVLSFSTFFFFQIIITSFFNMFQQVVTGLQTMRFAGVAHRANAPIPPVNPITRIPTKVTNLS